MQICLNTCELRVTKPFFQISEAPKVECDLSLGAMAYDFVKDEIKDSLEAVQGVIGINQYYPVIGNLELRKAIQESYGYPSAGSLVITNGAIHGLDLILRTLLKPGDEVLIPDPCFPAYFGLIQAIGGSIRTYSIDFIKGNTKIDLDQLREKISERTKFLILNFPHNPSGHVITQNELLEINEILEANPHVTYISDEVYSDMIYEGNRHISISFYNERGFVVNSFSKSFGLQGFRIGWIFSLMNKKMDSIIKTMGYTSGGVNSIGQEIARVSISKREYAWKFMNQNRQIALNYLDSKLANEDYSKAPGSFFLLIRKNKINSNIDSVKFFDGSLFGENTKNFIRISFAGKSEELLLGLKILIP